MNINDLNLGKVTKLPVKRHPNAEDRLAAQRLNAVYGLAQQRMRAVHGEGEWYDATAPGGQYYRG